MSDEEKFNQDEEFQADFNEEKYEDIPPPSEEPPQPIGYIPPADGTIQGEPIEPTLTDQELKKKKRRKWALISVFGIVLPILIIAGVFIFIMLSLVGAFENCAVNCCNNCADSCAQSCQESCCDNCSQSCNDSCNNACASGCETSCNNCNCSSAIKPITIVEQIVNIKNLYLWVIQIVVNTIF
ncbi:MAG: hypothetical protein FK734_10960 [Asgard group archaeon]|nr:hypothetical protein [Asgard group archaeon]